MTFSNNKNVDIRIECLVFGYVKEIGIIDKIIPSTIIELCIGFYYSISEIIYIAERHGEYPYISIAYLNQNKTYQTDIHKINSDKDKFVGKLIETGICYINCLRLPLNLSLNTDITGLNHKTLYNILFVIGSDKLRQKVDGYIIDPMQLNNNNSNNLDVYHWKLPSTNASSYRCYSLYSKKYGLISIGGKTTSMERLSFDNMYKNELKNDYEWKWETIDTMVTPRSLLAADFIDDAKIICCGGYNIPAKYRNECDIYDFKENKWIMCANLNQKRCRAGICVDKEKNKVYCGGGKINAESGLNTFEYYDIIKNKWLLLADSIGRHGCSPVLWMEDTNIINMASTWCNIFEQIDLRENRWTQIANPFQSQNIKLSNRRTRFCKI